MKDNQVKNPYWKNPYKPYVRILTWAWMIICFGTLGIHLYLYPNDANTPFMVVNILLWWGGIQYLRWFKKNRYDKWFIENENTKYISEEELMQLERQKKLERIINEEEKEKISFF
ncbi:MAG: hypothetical protein M0R46_11590 [Candidatus Muirbacterium halophilum]|nr:hypothetical protein [Candidatus Muirbacterium halophilum]